MVTIDRNTKLLTCDNCDTTVDLFDPHGLTHTEFLTRVASFRSSHSHVGFRYSHFTGDIQVVMVLPTW